MMIFSARPLLASSRFLPFHLIRSLATASTPSLPSQLQPPSKKRYPPRSYLYIPGSSPRNLKSAIKSTADALVFDLEDSVPQHCKGMGRGLVFDALQASERGTNEKYVRINSGQMAEDDLEIVLKSPNLTGLLIPKVSTREDLIRIDTLIDRHALTPEIGRGIKIVACVESALGIINLREIATASKRIDALLFASEDYTSSLSLLRTPQLSEMLYARQSLVTHAKAFGLGAIDLVCLDYTDQTILKEECKGGRGMGFSGKQGVHPSQVAIIQEAFSPSRSEINEALQILLQYEVASKKGLGAYGLQRDDGRKVMIDAPMLLQAQAVLDLARGLGMKLD